MTDTPQAFDVVTAVRQVDAARFAADLDPLWTIVGKPNGGYLQAIMARAALAATAGHPHVVTAASTYMSAPDPGPVHLDVETLRVGRAASQVRVRMTQGEQPCVETSFVLGDLSDVDADPRWQAKEAPAPGVAYDQCERFVPPREAFTVELLHQVEVRLEPDSWAFAFGSPRGVGELRGWLRLPGGADFDPSALLLAADVMPPATFDIQMTGWVPTFQMSTYVRALPAPGPVQILLKANVIHGGRVDETCTVWDSVGRLVAQSHQLAGIRL